MATNFHIEENLQVVKNNWIRAIENYCQEVGIEPMELIVCHKKKSLKTFLKKAKETQIKNFGLTCKL